MVIRRKREAEVERGVVRYIEKEGILLSRKKNRISRRSICFAQLLLAP